jgi:ribosome-associated protein
MKIFLRDKERMNAEQLKDLAISALDDLKGREIVAIDVRKLTGVTDYMVFCTGNSNRQVKSLANNVAVEAKKLGMKPLGSEGEQDGEWVLVDFGDVIVHVMLAETRAFYDLERLWTTPAGSQQAH